MSISLLTFLIILVVFCNGVTIQNHPSTSEYNVSFYLQDISNAECRDKWIIDVYIYNNQYQDWIKPTTYTTLTPYGDRYTWDCTQQPSIPNCEYSLPISIYLPTVNGEPMTLTDVITNFNSSDIFETTCSLCTNETQICSKITPTTSNPSVSDHQSTQTVNVFDSDDNNTLSTTTTIVQIENEQDSFWCTFDICNTINKFYLLYGSMLVVFFFIGIISFHIQMLRNDF